MSGSSINNSKLVSYQILSQADIRISKQVTYQLLSQADIRISKQVTYQLLSQADIRVSKQVTYQVLSQADIRVSKQVTYLILTSLPFPAPAPIRLWAQRQLPTDNRLKNIRPRTQFYDNTSLKAFSDNISAADAYTSVNNASISLSDSVASSDLVQLTGQITTSLADTAASSDAVADVMNAPISVSDNVSSGDLLSTSAATTATLSDTISSSDVVFVEYFQTLSDSFSSSDVLSPTFAQNITLLDAAHTSDQLQSPKVVFANISRVSLISGNSVAKLGFVGISREVLLSAGSSSGAQLNFAAISRVSLLQIVPGFGPIPIFPSLPQDFPVKLSPVLDTTIGTTKSLREMRVAQQKYPLWDIEINFEELVDQTQNQTPYSPFTGYEQFQQLVQLWLSVYGQTQVFAFNCPWDNSRANQLIGTGDGKTYVFTIVRTWGLGNQATTDPVGMVNAITSVQVGGVTVPSTKYFVVRDKIYFIDAKGFIYPPAANETITMTFSYYYLCRFVEDEQDFEEFAKNRWSVSSLKFRAVIWI